MTTVVGLEEVQLGLNYYEQRIVITGSPTGGSFWLWYLTKDNRTIALPITASAALIEQELRKLEFLDDVTVTGSSPVWTVTAGSNGSLVEPLGVASSFTGGTYPEANVEVTKTRQLHYRLAERGMFTEASVAPTIGRTDIGNMPERRTQSKAAEWFWGKTLAGGLGTRYFRENEIVDQIWDSTCATDSEEAISTARKVHESTLHASLSSAYSVTAHALGRTSNGVWLVAAFDIVGNGTQNRIGYYHRETDTWLPLPGTSSWASVSAIYDIVFYSGTMFAGWEESSLYGYLYWNGDTSTTPTKVALSTTDPWKTIVSMVEFDQKLFALQRDGTIIYTAVATPSQSDWLTLATYRGAGRVIAIRVFRFGDDQVLHLIATDGIYAISTFEQELKIRLPFHTRWMLTDYWNPQANCVVTWRGDLYLAVQDEVIYQYDGTNIRDISPWAKDGLPTKSIGINGDFGVRALLAGNHYLIACCNRSMQETGLSTTINSPTTISSPTTYMSTVTINDTLIINDTLYINDATSDASLILGYTNGGWHTLSPPRMGQGWGSQSAIIHQLANEMRLEFAPGKYLRFLDSRRRHYLWPKATYDTETRTVVTPYYDRNLSDIDKVAYFVRIGYADCGNGRTIAPYFEIDTIDDTNDPTASLNPTVRWVKMWRADGTTTAIGASSDDPPSGTAIFYFQDPTAHGNRGISFRQLRLRLDLKTDDDGQSPLLLWTSVVHGSKFDELFAYPLMLDLTDNAPDGRTPKRQRTDLLQKFRSRRLHRFSFGGGDIRWVAFDNLVFREQSTGPLEEAQEKFVANLQVTEQARIGKEASG